MFRILKQALRPGIITEPVSERAGHRDRGRQLKRIVDKHFQGSFAIRQVDAGSCNACELEIHALNNPYYDIERFGVRFVASPRHADALMITGPVSRHMQTALLRTAKATPKPRYIIATGDCACDGGEFGENYACCGPLQTVIPVDLQIPGCPPSPDQLIDGLLQLLGKL